MTIQIDDILEIPFNEDAWQRGVDYAMKSIFFTFNRMATSSLHKRAERIAIGVGLGEWSLEHYLNTNKIKPSFGGRTAWFREDKNDFILNDLKTDIKAFHLDENNNFHNKNFFDKKKNNRLKYIINNCKFLVPVDQFNTITKKDIYFCSVIEGKFLNNSPKKGVHFFWDYKWWKNRTPTGGALGRIKIEKSSMDKHIKLRLLGTKKQKEFYEEIIDIKEKNVVYSKNEFDDLFTCSQIINNPKGKLTISSEKKNISLDIKVWPSLSYQCSNIFLIGWCSRKDIEVNGDRLPRFSKDTGFYQDTKTDNIGISCSNLLPMKELKNYINGK